ncbi:hypothetical protein TNCV_253811 [Trichonephila clavipes]|nr:hypothetical protein TNCV_253811 [Trichonephila clavipes]
MKFCVHLGKRATKIYETLKHVIDNDAVSRKQSFEGHRRFIDVTWKSSQSLRKQKFHQNCCEEKVMLEVFLNTQSIVHLEFILEGPTKNKELYVDILRRLRQSTQKKRTKMHAEQSVQRLHDNAPAN